MAAASLWLLIRWLDSGKWLDGILFLAAGALLWRVHLVYWPFYFVYAIYFLARSDRKASWIQAIAIAAGLVLALLPVAYPRLAMSRDAAQHVFAPLPSWSELGETFKIRLVAGVRARGFYLCTLAARAARRFGPGVLRDRPDRRMVAGPASWLVRVFAPQRSQRVHDALRVDRVAGRSAWPPRPQSRFSFRNPIWQPLALVMGFAALIFGGQWSKLWPPHHNSDWRGASRAANALALGSIHAGIGRQPVRRSQAAGLEPGLPAPRDICIASWTCIRSTASPICFPMAIRPRGSSMPRLSRRARFRQPDDS